MCYGAELVSWIEYVERCSLSSFVLAQGMRVCCDCCKIILCIRRLVEWDRVLMRMRLWVINGIKKVSRPVGKVCCDSLHCSESLAHGGEDGIPTFFLWRRFVLFLVASSLIPTEKTIIYRTRLQRLIALRQPTATTFHHKRLTDNEEKQMLLAHQ